MCRPAVQQWRDVSRSGWRLQLPVSLTVCWKAVQAAYVHQHHIGSQFVCFLMLLLFTNAQCAFVRVPGCTSLLGMEGGAIVESQISASSIHYGILGLQRWGPDLARLNNQGLVNAWTSASHDKNPWIEVREAVKSLGGRSVPVEKPG